MSLTLMQNRVCFFWRYFSYLMNRPDFFFVFSIIFYNTVFEIFNFYKDKIPYFQVDFYFNCFIAVFYICFLILCFFQLIISLFLKNVNSRSFLYTLMLMASYVASIAFFPGYILIPIYSIKAFFITEVLSKCNGSKNDIIFEECYAYDDTVVARYIIKDSSRQMLEDYSSWQENIKQGIKDENFFGNFESCTNKKIYYLYSNFFLVDIACN